MQANGNLVVSGFERRLRDSRDVRCHRKMEIGLICVLRRSSAHHVSAATAAASSKRDAQNLDPLRCFHGNSLTLPCVWVVGGDGEWDSSGMDGRWLMMRELRKANRLRCASPALSLGHRMESQSSNGGICNLLSCHYWARTKRHPDLMPFEGFHRFGVLLWPTDVIALELVEAKRGKK